MISVRKKFFFIAIVFILSILYSAPNIYGESPVIIVKSDKIIDEFFIIKFNKFCAENGIRIKDLNIMLHKTLIIRFNSTEDQFFAYEVFKTLDIPVKFSLNILNNNSKFFEFIHAYPMKLGLDLRGGIHLLLKVHSKQLIKNFLNYNLSLIKNELYKNKIECKISSSNNSKFFTLYFYNKSDLHIIRNFIKDFLIDYTIVHDRNFYLKLKLNINKEFELKKQCIEKIMHVLSNRINELGISDSVIQEHGLSNIIIELPGIQDLIYAKNILGKTATLSFMFVDDKFNSTSNKQSKFIYTKDGHVLLLKNKELLDGSCVINATLGFDYVFNKPVVNIKINKEASISFKNITRENIGKFIAIIYKEYVIVNNVETLKETVINVAKIENELGETFQISGLNLEEAKDLSLLLRSGSLPTSISIVEEKLIGPTLGEKNITSAFKFILSSIFFIFFFMVVRYKTFGFISIISLSLNIFLILSIMSILGVTLTFPGLAGIALTLGISIDANILIFERINEEYIVGIDADFIEIGFKNAFTSILDSNITTLLIGVVLIIFATGPIRGFALTLSIGVITSFYSSIFVTKNLIDFLKLK